MPSKIVFLRPQNWSWLKILLLKHYYRCQGKSHKNCWTCPFQNQFSDNVGVDSICGTRNLLRHLEEKGYDLSIILVGSRTLRAQRLKNIKIALRDWNFQARLKMSSEPPAKPLLCGEFWRLSLKMSIDASCLMLSSGRLCVLCMHSFMQLQCWGYGYIGGGTPPILFGQVAGARTSWPKANVPCRLLEWKFQWRLKISSEIDHFKRDWFFCQSLGL